MNTLSIVLIALAVVLIIVLAIVKAKKKGGKEVMVKPAEGQNPPSQQPPTSPQM